MEEAKRKGLVVAVVGSAKDKAQELLVAEGLVFFWALKSCSILTFVNCYHTLHTLKVLNLNSGQAGGWKSSYSPWGYRDLQRDVKPCPSQSMSN